MMIARITEGMLELSDPLADRYAARIRTPSMEGLAWIVKTVDGLYSVELWPVEGPADRPRIKRGSHAPRASVLCDYVDLPRSSWPHVLIHAPGLRSVRWTHVTDDGEALVTEWSADGSAARDAEREARQ